MFTRQTFTNLFFVTAIATAGVAALSTPAEAGKKPCSKDLQFDEVKKACGEKGQIGAKQLMKRIEKAAKNKGGKGSDYKCEECHADKKEYALKDGAVDKYKQWRAYLK